MDYELKLTTTAETIGFYSCEPQKDLPLAQSLSYLVQHPMDTFMRKFILRKLGALSLGDVQALFKQFGPLPLPLQTLAYELFSLSPKFENLAHLFKDTPPEELQKHTSLIILRVLSQKDHNLHQQWIEIFARNILRHKELPLKEEINISEPIVAADSAAEQLATLDQVHSQLKNLNIASKPLPSIYDLARTAYTALQRCQTFASIEMRHENSLSPIGLLRKWSFKRQIKSKKLSYGLQGIQTSFGRGFNLDQARVGLYMEMVERFSSFASISSDQIMDLSGPNQVYVGSYTELKSKGFNCLNPNELCLDLQYQDEALHWMQGEKVIQPGQTEPVLVPIQLVYLFTNLDEVDLFDGLGSTGLAAGATIPQAKFAGLLEVLERDSEVLGFYEPQKCFRLTAEGTPIARLLDKLAQHEIYVVFQDLTNELGLPCFKVFVQSMDGQIIKGTGAHLNGQKAIVSALTEVPYPFPHGPKTKPWPKNLTEKNLRDLPNYSLGDVEANLYQLESLLTKNNYFPIYVNLTRKDLGLPVIRAIIPGLELLADFDDTTRVRPRLWEKYKMLGS
ncbi:YcaO-like family protein [Desulfovulcanus sp.]